MDEIHLTKRIDSPQYKELSYVAMGNSFVLVLLTFFAGIGTGMGAIIWLLYLWKPGVVEEGFVHPVLWSIGVSALWGIAFLVEHLTRQYRLRKQAVMVTNDLLNRMRRK